MSYDSTKTWHTRPFMEAFPPRQHQPDRDRTRPFRGCRIQSWAGKSEPLDIKRRKRSKLEDRGSKHAWGTDKPTPTSFSTCYNNTATATARALRRDLNVFDLNWFHWRYNTWQDLAWHGITRYRPEGNLFIIPQGYYRTLMSCMSSSSNTLRLILRLWISART